jgi:hypothetical protein
MKNKTMTHTRANLKDDKAHLYGLALWLISQEETTTAKIVALSTGMSVGKGLHDYYVNAGMLERVKYGAFRWSANAPRPTRQQCIDLYKSRTDGLFRKEYPSASKRQAKKSQEFQFSEKPSSSPTPKKKAVKKASKPKARPTPPQAKPSLAYTILKRFFPSL